MNYDILIIGAGPSGLTAGIYAVRAGYNVAIIEKQFAGGQIANTESVDNYPGLLSISGAELSFKMLEQAEKLGVKMIYDTVIKTHFSDEQKVVYTENSGEITAKAIILCTGASPRKLGVLGEEKFVGRGVSYCALCDGAFYKDKNVLVVGGGNTAIADCLYLTKFAKNVYLVHRRDSFRASKSDTQKMLASGVKVFYDSQVVEIIGDKKIEQVAVQNKNTKQITTLDIDGVFVAIGHLPTSEVIAPEVQRDEYGYILSDEDMKTNIAGVFVAGDVRRKKVRQVVTACSDGAIASEMASEYIKSKE